MSAISLESVRKTYQLGHDRMVALDDVCLSVEAGTIQGIIGFSGSGKTTLLRCVSRLETVDAGRVIVDGADLAHLDGAALRVARRRLGIVFQQYHLLRSRTVAENVALPLELAGVNRATVALRVQELLSWFGLADKRDVYPSQLSGGQKQRVAIARALATRPAVLLSDEPTSALDAETTASVLETLRRVRDQMGITVLLVTHELSAVRAICDQVAVLDHGRIVEQTTVPELFLRPVSDAARRLLGQNESLSRFEAIAAGGHPAGTTCFVLQFIGDSADRPLLTDAARRYGVDIHLLHGEAGRLGEVAYGNFVVAVRGDDSRLSEAVRFFQENGASVTSLHPGTGAARA